MVTIVGTSVPDTITPGNNSASNDPLEGDDIIQGLGGDDTIDAGKGMDTVDAGPGDDDVDGNEDEDILSGGDGNDTIRGGKGDDTINGDDDDDYLIGGADKDILNGGDGNDILDGADDGQEDILNGGAGIDFADYRNATQEQVIDFGNIGALRDLPTAASYEVEKDQWISIEGVYGATHFSNTIIGDGTTNYLMGGDESDSLSGLGGIDLLEGRGGNDGLDGGSEIDILNGGAGDDTLIGGSGGDQFYFEVGEMDGDDEITDFVLGSDFVVFYNTSVTSGNLAAQIFFGHFTGPGNDIELDTGEGGTITLTGVTYSNIVDYVVAGGAFDSIFLLEESSGSTSVAAAALVEIPGSSEALPESNFLQVVEVDKGRDTIIGNDGAQFISTGRGKDVVSALGGTDLIFGGARKDVIDGGDGDDLIDGGTGRDFLTGGQGDDVFVFGHKDRILDFMDGDDRIAILASEGADFEDLTIKSKSAGTLVKLGDQKLWLIGYDGTLEEDDFILDYVPSDIDPETFA